MAKKSDCIEAIIKASGHKMTEQEAESLLKYVEFKHKKTNAKQHLESNETKFLAALEQEAKEVLKVSQIQKRNKILSFAAREKAHQFIGQFKNPFEGVKALLVGINKPIRGARLSIAAQQQATIKSVLGGFYTDLKKSDMLEFAKSGELDREIAIELEQLTIDNGKPGKTESASALAIAKVMKKYRDITIERLNMAGAYIKQRAGYITRQTHDAQKIHNIGFEEWKRDILELLDHEETFGDNVGDSVNEFLNEAYLGIISGQHTNPEYQSFDTPPVMLKSPGLANKLSKQRKIHFKDAEAWFTYNEKYGRGNLMENFLRSVEKGASDAVLMEVLGPNPEENLFGSNGIIRTEQLKTRNKPDIHEQLADPLIQALYNKVAGKADIPHNVTIHRISSAIYNLNIASKLGSVVLSAVSDFPFLASEARYLGLGTFNGYAQALKNVFISEEDKQIAASYALGLETMLGDFVGRIAAVDGYSGVTSKIARLSMKLGLLPQWTDSHKAGFGVMLASHLGNNSNKKITELSDEMQRAFKLYDISSTEWDVIRKAAQESPDKNGKIISMDILENIHSDEIRKLMPDYEIITLNNIEQRRNLLKTKLLAFFHDRADFAVLTPGKYENVLLQRNVRLGTIEGELLRHVLQFKAFPLSVITKLVGPGGRDVAGLGHDVSSLLKSSDLMGYISLQLQLTVFGLFAMWLKDISKGKEPRDASDPKTWIQASLQSGGLGIYGDFMFGEYNRFGTSFWSSMLGPTAGAIESFEGIKSKMMYEGGKGATAEAFKLVSNNLPFINTFYLRGVYNYLFMYQLQELLNPGYLSSMERGIIDKTNQEFIIPPSSVVPHGSDQNYNLFERGAETLENIQGELE